jgi:SET domain-containing protein
VRRSPIHGRGVFARNAISAGEVILGYRGALIRWEQAIEDAGASSAPAGHTLLFDVGDGFVIDGGRGGNSARWINHSCEPNCEAVTVGRAVVIHALRDVEPGEELLLDYQLQLDSDHDESVRAAYACRCGAPSCRSTMLAAAG